MFSQLLCLSTIKATESTVISLRTQFTSLEIVVGILGHGSDLVLHLRGKIFMPSYTLLSLWKFLEFPSLKKNHRQADGKKARQIYIYKIFIYICINIYILSSNFLTSSSSLCVLTQHDFSALAFLPLAYSSPRTDLSRMFAPHSAESSMQMCWLQNNKSGNSPANFLA